MEVKAAKVKAATIDQKISHRKQKSQSSFLKKVKKNKTLLLMTLPVIIFSLYSAICQCPGFIWPSKYNYGDGILKVPCGI